jgi:hypothetical protein
MTSPVLCPEINEPPPVRNLPSAFSSRRNEKEKEEKR